MHLMLNPLHGMGGYAGASALSDPCGYHCLQVRPRGPIDRRQAVPGSAGEDAVPHPVQGVQANFPHPVQPTPLMGCTPISIIDQEKKDPPTSRSGRMRNLLTVMRRSTSNGRAHHLNGTGAASAASKPRMEGWLRRRAADARRPQARRRSSSTRSLAPASCE